MPSSTRFDAIIIGAGHNGLVTACYLARAGLKVLVLERRHIVGGACVTEELFPGFKVSTAAYVNGLFRPEIIRDLRLADYGFQMLERNPSSFTPFPDGRSLLLGPDEDWNRREVAKFSPRDAERMAGYDGLVARVADVLEPFMLSVPPRVPGAGAAAKPSFSEIFAGLSPKLAGEVLDILTGSVADLLDRFFESDQFKATLATDGIIGTFAPPSAPGTAYVLFHHVMGETFGNRGIWSYVKGGMGMLTGALAAAARDMGAEIRTDAPVTRLLVENGAVAGVVLENGDEFRAPVVASNATAEVTFTRLMDPGLLPPDFADMVGRIDYRSASLKINCALSALPEFKCLPNGGRPGPQHRGTFHIAPTMEYLERAYDDAKYGRPSASPVLEGALPTVVDPSLAPPGKHILSLFIQYAPYTLKGGTWDQAAKDRFADRCFDVLEEYAPGFKRSVIDRRIYAPPDIERTFGLTGGNIFQGAVSLRQFFAFRPLPGYGDHRTPIRGLYLCGSAAHPGGGVMGVAGRNASQVMLSDRG